MSGICAEFWTWEVTQTLIEKKNKYFGDALLIRREFYWKNFSNLIKYTKKNMNCKSMNKNYFLAFIALIIPRIVDGGCRGGRILSE